jgi:two-component system, OmpR family, phosphate regulon sensor histidine kinase PhoR
MIHRKLIWHFYPWFLITTLIAIFMLTWYTSSASRTFFLQRTQFDLQNQSLLLKPQITKSLLIRELERIDQLCKEFGIEASTRITVILPDGRVIGDSEKNPSQMDSHIDRPEVMQAIHDGMGTSLRYSGTLGQTLMYEAIQLKDPAGRLIGILRTSIPVTAIDKKLKSIQLKIIFGGLIIALLSSIVMLFISRRITKPIEQMKKGAERFAKGELDLRLPTPVSSELASLTEAMNQMAGQLQERIKTVISQRNEYEAVLSSMQEGVIAVDSDERLLSINQAALDMLKIETVKAKGRTIQETLRIPEFLEYVSDSLAGKEMEDKDFEILEGNHTTLINIRSAPLKDAKNLRIGSLLVLNDVTKVRHLENVRKDFVANVSHELKTPLTAIKGFVETLHETLLQPSADAEEFFAIIMRQVDRLNAIIEDLLMLSRLEQFDNIEQIKIEKRDLKRLIENAIHVVQLKAEKKNISFDIACEPDTPIQVDSSIFEQALINLLDNAVAYSPENETVHITVEMLDHEMRIHVIDHGPGISLKHQPRLFERFYRVDKSRSRTLGGTGLGLAIVKHIVKAHGGRVSVQSELGKGSSFTIHHPA